MEFRMPEEFISIPEVYVLNHNILPEEVSLVRSSLGMTPIHTVFITDNQQITLAMEFVPPIDIYKTKNEADAIVLGHAVYLEIRMPCLVIGEAPLLDAVYKDDHREAINVR